MDSWQSADGRDIENELDQAEAYAKEQERQVEEAEESEAPEPQNAPQYGEPKPAPAEHQAVAQALAGWLKFLDVALLGLKIKKRKHRSGFFFDRFLGVALSLKDSIALSFFSKSLSFF